jgi:hypothetical protein
MNRFLGKHFLKLPVTFYLLNSEMSVSPFIVENLKMIGRLRGIRNS